MARPLSQQLAPEELVLSEKPIARDVLERKSIRHEPLLEKHLPQYPSIHRQPPQQQLPPNEVHSLPRVPAVFPGDEFNSDKPDLIHEPSAPQRNRKPEAVRTAPPRAEKRPNGMDKKKSDSNGELPNDQVIPLEELPREQQPYYTPPPTLTAVDDQPLLRRPRRRRQDKPKTKSDGYKAKLSLCLGIILIIIGILEIILNTIGIVFQELYRPDPVWNIIFYLAPGIWCSIFFILCGIFGVISARVQVTWAIVTHLVVATLASVFALILIVTCGLGIHKEVTASFEPDTDLHLPSLIILCIMALLALIALPLALCCVVICCQVFCRKPAAST